MTDGKELRKRIKSKGYMLSFVADELEITPASLTNKLDNKTSFKLDEVSQLCKILDIKSLKDKEALFFAQ